MSSSASGCPRGLVPERAFPPASWRSRVAGPSVSPPENPESLSLLLPSGTLLLPPFLVLAGLWRRCCCCPSPAVAIGLSCSSTVAGMSTAAVVACWLFVAADAIERSAGRSTCQAGSPGASQFWRVCPNGTALAPQELAAGSFLCSCACSSLSALSASANSFPL